MCDSNGHAAGCDLLIEDNTDKETRETSKFIPVAFGSKRLTTGKTSLTMYAKKFLAMHLASDVFGHSLWGTKEPTIVMTANKALTKFFQAKHFPRCFGFFVIKPYN